MRKLSIFEMVSAILVGIAGLLYVIFDLILVIEASGRGGVSVNSTILGVGNVVYAALILAALAFAILERKVLVGILVASLKITLPYGGAFISSAFKGARLDFSNTSTIFSLLFFLIGVALIVMIPFVVKDTKFEKVPFKWMTFLGPILVFAFLILFEKYEVALVSSLAEVVALLLLAVMTARFLFISVFIIVPFHMIGTLVARGSSNAPQPALPFGTIAYWVIGIGLLIFGIYALVMHILHSKHDHVDHEPSAETQVEA